MKRLAIVLAVLFVFSASAYAQMGMMGGAASGEQKGVMKPCGMMMSEEQQMPMCQQMMLGQNMMMKDMMQMMMELLNMQESMMKGLKAEEKKKMMKDIGQMKEKMQKMMSMCMGTMTMDDSQKKLKCAEEWLKKAISLHEVHIKDPMTATEASRMEMMDQMKKAYGCIAETGSEIKNASPKEPAAGEKKKDAHGH